MLDMATHDHFNCEGIIPDFITSAPCYKRTSAESGAFSVPPGRGYKRAKSQPVLAGGLFVDDEPSFQPDFNDDTSVWNSSLLSHSDSADLLQWLDDVSSKHVDSPSGCSLPARLPSHAATREDHDPPGRSGSSSSSTTCINIADDAPADNASDDSNTGPYLRPPDEPFAWESDPVVAESLRFMRTLPSTCSQAPLNSADSLLPPHSESTSGRPTLLLDLDETLVHSALTATPAADFSFTVEFNDNVHVVYVQLRPGLQQFLRFVSEHFEVVVFTASLQLYAEKVLDMLDPDGSLFAHRIYRDSCVFFQDGMYLKDLSRVGRDLARTAILDNSPQVFGFQVDNGIPILSWYGDREDKELLKLEPLLLALLHVDDVRPLLRRYFSLAERIAAA